MRSIEFRGKIDGVSKGDGWFYGLPAFVPFKQNDLEPGYYMPNSGGYMFAFRVIPETLGQYTSLKDKNGVKIFEGDVVRYGDFKRLPEPSIAVGKVAWQNGAFTIDGEYLGYITGANIEVIGNIHDNPELPEEKK